MWFGKRHKRHKIRKPSNHAALRCGVLKIKNATRFFQVILFLYFWIHTNQKKKITEPDPFPDPFSVIMQALTVTGFSCFR